MYELRSQWRKVKTPIDLALPVFDYYPSNDSLYYYFKLNGLSMKFLSFVLATKLYYITYYSMLLEIWGWLATDALHFTEQYSELFTGDMCIVVLLTWLYHW